MAKAKNKTLVSFVFIHSCKKLSFEFILALLGDAVEDIYVHLIIDIKIYINLDKDALAFVC